MTLSPPKTHRPRRPRPHLRPAIDALFPPVPDGRSFGHRLLDALFPHDTLHVGGKPYMRRWYVFGYAPTEGDPDATMICATCKVELARLPGELDGEPWYRHLVFPDKRATYDADHDPVPVSAPRSGWRWRDHGLGAFRIHCTTSSDDSRAFHDHPWPFASIIVRGAYRELRPSVIRYATDGLGYLRPSWCPRPGDSTDMVDSRVYRAPALNVKHAEDLHVLEVVDGPVWSLFFTRPKVRSWGFAGPFGWLPWRTFDAEYPERDAYTEMDGAEFRRG